MIVRDFDVVRVPLPPNKADAELIIDVDGVLPLAIALQCLEAIARRNPQIIQAIGSVNHQQFS